MFDDWPVVYYPCACIVETMHSVVLESVEGVLISGIVWRERERETLLVCHIQALFKYTCNTRLPASFNKEPTSLNVCVCMCVCVSVVAPIIGGMAGIYTVYL